MSEFFVTASVDGIDDVLRQIDKYRQWVERKTRVLQERVAQIIRDNADAVFSVALLDDTFAIVETDASGKRVQVADAPKVGGNVSVTIDHDGDGDKFTLVIARGNDGNMDHIWMEFGAGVYYNGAVGSSPHPQAGKFGYVIGGYGKGMGKNNIWGYYGDDGKLHLTHGTPASMPLYRSMMEAWEDIIDIARQVFET